MPARRVSLDVAAGSGNDGWGDGGGGGLRGCAGDGRPLRTGFGGELDDVAHLRDYLPELQEYDNPLVVDKFFHPIQKYFTHDCDVIARDVGTSHPPPLPLLWLADAAAVLPFTASLLQQRPLSLQVVGNLSAQTETAYYRRGGPRQKVMFRSDEVKAAIVTCGGLCPGLNTVIRELVMSLWRQYGVRNIEGIHGGYRGFYSYNTVPLMPRVVTDWHKRGGTMLGTTRGGHDTKKIVDSIEDRGINMVFIIGGDGTQRGAILIHQEIVARGLKVVVCGIPKTVDNDVAIIDRSFGAATAAAHCCHRPGPALTPAGPQLRHGAQAAINAAHVEAESTPMGVGLVKVMGRYAGHIATAATMASRDVDCVLIPEVPFWIDGPGGLAEFMEAKLAENGHCVILVAEGAGQDLVAALPEVEVVDASGNRLLLDIGLWLGTQLKVRLLPLLRHRLLATNLITTTSCSSLHLMALAVPTPLSLFLRALQLRRRGGRPSTTVLSASNPTYMVRAVPSNAADTIYCTLLAHNAVHGAMAGYTGFICGPRVVDTQNIVNVQDRTWAWVRSVNNQPDFFRAPDDGGIAKAHKLSLNKDRVPNYLNQEKLRSVTVGWSKALAANEPLVLGLVVD
eukprot:SM000243S08599  [mRNA]  locus=s243:126996:134508:- [translate_table: standard]